MKYFKKLIGERIYLSPRNNEDIEQFTECGVRIDIWTHLMRENRRLKFVI